MPNRTYLGWVFNYARTRWRQDSAAAAGPPGAWPIAMKPADLTGFGATQWTLGEFVEVGWRPTENYC